jgi:hypothetical protein
MKWGVRRFQNADGTLTAKGKARMNDVANSKLKSKRDTKLARATYKYNAKTTGNMSTSYAKDSAKLEKKATKYVKGSAKYNDLMAKSKEAARRSKEMSDLSDIATQKIRDIDEGKLKAGRDFIVQIDMNVNLTKIPAWTAIMDDHYKPSVGKMSRMSTLGYNDYKVIERKSSDAKARKELHDLKMEREKLQRDIARLYSKGRKYDKDTPWDKWNESDSDKIWYEYDDKGAELLAMDRKIKEIENS